MRVHQLKVALREEGRVAVGPASGPGGRLSSGGPGAGPGGGPGGPTQQLAVAVRHVVGGVAVTHQLEEWQGERHVDEAAVLDALAEQDADEAEQRLRAHHRGARLRQRRHEQAAATLDVEPGWLYPHPKVNLRDRHTPMSTCVTDTPRCQPA